MDPEEPPKKSIYLLLLFLALAVCTYYVLAKWAKLSPAVRVDAVRTAIAFDQGVLDSANTAEALEALSKKFPNQAAIFEKLGATYLKANNLKEAAKNLERAGTVNPENFGTFNSLGNVYYLLGDRQKAAECWAQSIVINPTQTECRINLAVVYNEQGRLNESLGQLHEVLKIEPENKKAAETLKKITNKKAKKTFSHKL